MKVNVTKKAHFAKVDGVLTELALGEQEIDTKTAESMIGNGYAVKVEAAKPKPKSKQAE
tara:strand:- start:1530 stop:1706 length:177 start_codon:yes stop_codon:yes gene_type:complete